ncbi:MAG: DUF805 domain-containing protein [Rhodobacteraceae bacterium]|nr:DUF805 domain-containing protein [Paracoccaceae bacterium]
MTPGRAIATGLRQSFTLSGRAMRAEFWWFFALHSIGPVLLILLAFLFGARALLLAAGVLFLVTMPGVLAAIVRRRHDVGRSGVLTAVTYLACIVAMVLAIAALIDTAITFATDQSVTGAALDEVDLDDEDATAVLVFSSPMLATTAIMDLVVGGAIVGALGLALLSILGLPVAILLGLVALALIRPSQSGPNAYGPNPHEVTT